MKAAERVFVVAFAAATAAAPARAQPATCPAAKEWPTRIRIEYDVTASRGPFSINGDSVLEFQRKGTAYSITVETEAVAIYRARQSSRGTVEPGGLRPDEYVEVRGTRKPATTTFDWTARRVRFSVAPDVAAEAAAGIQDRATLPLQIAWMQRRSPAVAAFELPLAGSRSVGVSRFLRKGNESVKVSLGTVDAVRFERPADEDHDHIEAWFSPDWCGLPVRVRYADKKGSVIDHRMRGARVE